MTKIPSKRLLPKFIKKNFGYLAKSTFEYDVVDKISRYKPIYLLTNPEDIKYVLLTNSKNYIKTPHISSASGKKRVGKGLFSSYGTNHRRQRSLLQPNFRQSSLATYMELILSNTRKVIDFWQDGDTIDITQTMAKLSQTILIQTLFGEDFEDRDHEFSKAISCRRRYTEYIYHSKLPYAAHLPTAIVREYREAIQVIDRIINNEISTRRQQKNYKEDLLSKMMQATYPNGEKMSDQLLRDECLTLTSTGYETVGEALSWTIYLLATHPAIKEKLLDEIKQVLAGKPLTFSNITQLTYLELVLSESLRLFPPTWMYVRTPLTPDKLPSGYSIPAKSILYLPQYLMHRHPAYFEQPEVFNPDRFKDVQWRKSIRYTYFPFGIGAHKCIGDSFAKLEANLVLAQLLQTCQFELVPNQKIQPIGKVTLRPKKGILVKVKK